MYLSLDGSATIYVNSSVPALNALRGTSFDVRPNAPLDREAVREYFTTPVTRVTRVSSSRRNNRRFVHVRLDVDDVRRLAQARAVRVVDLSVLEGWRCRHLPSDGRRCGGEAGGGGALDGTGNRRVPAAPAEPDRRTTTPGRATRSAATSWRGSSRWPSGSEARRLTLDARMEPQSILYSTPVAVRRHIRGRRDDVCRRSLANSAGRSGRGACGEGVEKRRAMNEGQDGQDGEGEEQERGQPLPARINARLRTGTLPPPDTFGRR